MRGAENQELTFEVGLAAKGGKPDIASFKMKGALASMNRELYVDDDLQMVLVDADGQVILSAYGVVRGIQFKKHAATERRPSFVERIHSIALGEQSEPDS